MEHQIINIDFSHNNLANDAVPYLLSLVELLGAKLGKINLTRNKISRDNIKMINKALQKRYAQEQQLQKDLPIGKAEIYI